MSTRVLLQSLLEAGILLAVMMATVLANVVCRYVLNQPLVWGDEVASLAFIWMAMLGAAIAVDRHEHLRLTIFLPLIPARIRGWVEVAGLVVTCILLLRLLRTPTISPLDE